MTRSVLFAVCTIALSACGGSDDATDGNDANLPVVALTARQWSYSPSTIQLKKGVPVFIEITSEDVHHGFNLPEFGVRADAIPNMKSRVKVVPDKTGTFDFHCDYYCGSGHEGMQGQVVVE